MQLWHRSVLRSCRPARGHKAASVVFIIPMHGVMSVLVLGAAAPASQPQFVHEGIGPARCLLLNMNLLWYEQALRRNPYAPDVPCHRVVTTALTLGGFDGSWVRSQLIAQTPRACCAGTCQPNG